MIQVINTTKELKAFCKKWKKQPFITVDTEFLREKTYFSVLCLIQIGCLEEDLCACVDPLQEDMDLSALLELMKNKKVLKVFHSARQDLEIFYQLMQQLPTPVFDTQIGAMVCGLGENVSYHNIVHHYLGVDLDKSSRITDWSVRPLSEKQIVYAMGDVTYLAKVYDAMQKQLQENGRTSWVSEEMDALLCDDLYNPNPDMAWHRLKPASTQGRYLSVLQALCAWREAKAIEHNRPRRYILRDEQVLELAALCPQKMDDFKRLRGKSISENSSQAEQILQVVSNALNLPPEQHPHFVREKTLTPAEQAIKEVLKLLLNVISCNLGVASKLIASSDDLSKMASSSKPDILAMKGWRFDVFGQKAMEFKKGRLSLAFDKKTNSVIFENR